MDIFVEVPRIEYEKLAGEASGEPSLSIRARVEQARQLQRDRFAGTKLTSNADMGPMEVRRYCIVDDQAQGLLATAMKRLNLSARAFHRILKLSRTIADLASSELITAAQVAEAIQYRPRRLV